MRLQELEKKLEDFDVLKGECKLYEKKLASLYEKGVIVENEIIIENEEENNSNEEVNSENSDM